MLFGNAITLLNAIVCLIYFTFIISSIVLVIVFFIHKVIEFGHLYGFDYDEEEDYIITEDGEVIPYDEDTQE